MAHRADAIYPATVVGKPRQEDFFIGDLLQELLSPLFPLVMPAVEQLWSYGETGYHSLAAAVVKQRYTREAMASAFRILGEGQLSLTKFLLVTDRHVDLRDFKATLEHVLARTHPETDLYVFSNLSMDTLDYTGPDGERGIEGRVARARRSGARPAAAVHAAAAAGRASRDVRVFCGGCLVVGGAVVRRRARRRRRGSPPTRPSRTGRWSSLTDEPRAPPRSDMNFLWTTFTRFEPAADIHAAERADRPQPHRLRGPDRDRRAAEAGVSEGAVVPTRTPPRW